MDTDVLSHPFNHSLFSVKCQVCVWSRTMESAMACAEEIKGEACLSAEEAVDNADIIVTATFSETPILKKAWVKPGAHINGLYTVLFAAWFYSLSILPHPNV